MLVFDQIEGPGLSIPVRGLVLGLFWFSQIALKARSDWHGWLTGR